MPDAFVQPWHDQTTVHPLGLVAMLVLGLAVLVVPRRLAIVPLLVLACFVAPAQRIVILTLDFNFLRIMVALAWMRVLYRREWREFAWKAPDVVVFLWALCGTVAYTVLHGTLASFVNRGGYAFDAIGLYFLVRILVRSFGDVLVLTRWAALVAIPVATLFIVERHTARNHFSLLGGVPEITLVRQGRLRCQGAFPHPILAGCFWVSLVPLFAALLWRRAGDRCLGWIGLGSAIAVIIACASSTPLVALGVAAVGAAFFPVRGHLRIIRWVIVLGAIGVHFARSKPLWHLLARVDIAGGSTGWYRYLLIDRFIERFDEWALFGTRSTAGWWVYGLGDVTNQYVLQGVDGGLMTLLLFVALIVLVFQQAGRLCRNREDALRDARRLRPGTRGRRRRGIVRRRRAELVTAWALGVCLLIHVSVFVAVSYFAQCVLVWNLTLGVIVSLAPAGMTSPRAVARAIARRRTPSPGVSAPARAATA